MGKFRVWFMVFMFLFLALPPVLAQEILRPGTVSDVNGAEVNFAILTAAGPHQLLLDCLADVEIVKDPLNAPDGMAPEQMQARTVFISVGATGAVEWAMPYDGLVWLKLHNAAPLLDIDGHPLYPMKVGLDVIANQAPPPNPEAAPPPAAP